MGTPSVGGVSLRFATATHMSELAIVLGKAGLEIPHTQVLIDHPNAVPELAKVMDDLYWRYHPALKWHFIQHHHEDKSRSGMSTCFANLRAQFKGVSINANTKILEPDFLSALEIGKSYEMYVVEVIQTITHEVLKKALKIKGGIFGGVTGIDSVWRSPHMHGRHCAFLNESGQAVQVYWETRDNGLGLIGVDVSNLNYCITPVAGESFRYLTVFVPSQK